MALDFQNYLYSSSPPDFELFTPLYLGKRRRSPPKISTSKLAVSKEEGWLDASLQRLRLQDSDVSDDCLYEDFGVDIVGLTKCTDRCAISQVNAKCLCQCL